MVLLFVVALRLYREVQFKYHSSPDTFEIIERIRNFVLSYFSKSYPAHWVGT